MIWRRCWLIDCTFLKHSAHFHISGITELAFFSNLLTLNKMMSFWLIMLPMGAPVQLSTWQCHWTWVLIEELGHSLQFSPIVCFPLFLQHLGDTMTFLQHISMQCIPVDFEAEAISCVCVYFATQLPTTQLVSILLFNLNLTSMLLCQAMPWLWLSYGCFKATTSSNSSCKANTSCSCCIKVFHQNLLILLILYPWNPFCLTRKIWLKLSLPF